MVSVGEIQQGLMQVAEELTGAQKLVESRLNGLMVLPHSHVQLTCEFLGEKGLDEYAELRTSIDLSSLYKPLQIQPIPIEECPLSITSFKEFAADNLGTFPPRRFYVILLHDIVGMAQVVEAREALQHFAINGFVNTTNAVALKFLHLFEARTSAPFEHVATLEFRTNSSPAAMRVALSETIAPYVQANSLTYSTESGKTRAAAQQARTQRLQACSDIKTKREEEDFLHYTTLALVDRPGNPVHVGKIKDYIEQRPEQAGARLQKVQEYFYFDYGVQTFLGAFLHHPTSGVEQNSTQSEQHFRRALALMPDNLSALSGLGILLVELKRFQEAKEPLEIAVALQDNRAAVHAALAAVHEHAGERRVAEAHFKRARTLEPDNEMIQYHYGAFLFQEKRYEDVRQQLRGFSEELSAAPKEVIAAVKNLKHESELFLKSQATGLAMVARTKREQKKKTEALDLVHKALIKDPNCKLAKEELAQLQPESSCIIA